MRYVLNGVQYKSTIAAKDQNVCSRKFCYRW